MLDAADQVDATDRLDAHGSNAAQSISSALDHLIRGEKHIISGDDKQDIRDASDADADPIRPAAEVHPARVQTRTPVMWDWLGTSFCLYGWRHILVEKTLIRKIGGNLGGQKPP